MTLLSSLQQIVGEENATTDIPELVSYSTDASGAFGKAIAIVFPTSPDHIRKIILFAASRDHRLVPRGAGTGLAGGAVPQDSIVVDLSRMARIKKIDVKGKQAVVEPGVVVDDLNKALAQYDLFFPVIPSSHGVCTIGGMAAADAAGLRALRFGKMSDWVTGTKAIDGTGKSYTFNGKNDFLGTEGIFGIITEIQVALTDRPGETRHEKMVFSSAASMTEKVSELIGDKRIVSLEFLDRISSRVKGLKDAYHLFAEYDEKPSEDEDPEDVLKDREGVSVLLGGEGYDTTEDPKIPIDKMAEFLGWLEQRNIPCFGHIGYGIIHPRFKADQEGLIHEMFKKVISLGGEVSGEHGIGLMKRGFLSAERAAALRHLKEAYDPQDIMNRGKVI